MKYKLSAYFANLGLEDVKMNCSTATGGEFLIGVGIPSREVARLRDQQPPSYA